jgi:hypothetical protein
MKILILYNIAIIKKGVYNYGTEIISTTKKQKDNTQIDLTALYLSQKEGFYYRVIVTFPLPILQLPYFCGDATGI